LLFADWVLSDRAVAQRHYRQLSQSVWGRPDIFEPAFTDKAPAAIWMQHQHVLIDSLPLCDFAFPQLARPIENREAWEGAADVTGDLDLGRRLLNAVTGRDFGQDDLERAAERAFTLERALLARAGRSRAMEETLAPHFKLPCRSDGTLIDAAGFGQLMDEYYGARGWDPLLGWPDGDCLARLGLPDVAREIEVLRTQLAGGHRIACGHQRSS
jgi:aldehyde:ferredoxin oxidoreductase